MMELFVTLLTFLAGFLAVFSINLVISDLFEKDRQEMEKRRMELMRLEQRERAKESAASKGPYKSLGTLAAEAQQNDENRTPAERFTDWLEQSGVRWSKGKVIQMAIVWGAFLGLPFGILSGKWTVGVAVAVLATTLPLVFINFKRRQRLENLLGQMPEAMDLMSRILKSGQTITQSIQAVANEFEPPISTEFTYCYEQQNLGLAPEVAFRDLSRRTGLLEMKIFVLAVMVNRQSGGNMAALLGNLANVIRKRHQLRSKVRAITAEGRLQAIMLLALPPLLYAAILVLNPSYGLKLLDHPTLVIITLVSMTLGALMIRKIVNFDY